MQITEKVINEVLERLALGELLPDILRSNRDYPSLKAFNNKLLDDEYLNNRFHDATGIGVHYKFAQLNAEIEANASDADEARGLKLQLDNLKAYINFLPKRQVKEVAGLTRAEVVKQVEMMFAVAYERKKAGAKSVEIEGKFTPNLDKPDVWNIAKFRDWLHVYRSDKLQEVAKRRMPKKEEPELGSGII